MELTLNGTPVSVEVEEDESLLDLLRGRLGLRSPKDGCAPEGSCGACTVIVDGHAVVSCAQKATRVAGKEVVTQEGLSEETRRLWADGFVAAGASQCGFCSPGILMKAEALLARNPDPSGEEVAHALLGNLCRCTGYVKIVDAVLLVAALRRGEPGPTPVLSGRVGARAARYEGRELALGDKPFVADLVEPGMLHGALRFSDHPRARVVRIDTSKAAAHPGVRAVVTAADVRGRRAQGTITQDWRQLVAEGEETAYVGDVLAAVAADTRRAAREAAALVEVEYEVLEPITDPFDPRAIVLSTSVVKRGDVGPGTLRRRPLGDRDLPDAVHRARVPRAGGGARRPRGVRAAPRLLTGSGRLGRPASDRVVPGDPRGAPDRDPGLDRRGVRREGGPERPVPRGAARVPHAPPGARRPEQEGESPLPRQAPPDVARVHRGLRRGGQAARGQGADRRRLRRLRERRCQGARARCRPRVRRVQGAERRRRGDGRLHEQSAVRRDARLRRQPVQLRDRGRPRPARRAGRDRRLGDPLAERARSGRPLLHRAAARPRRRPEADAACSSRRLPRRAVRGDRLRSEEHGHRQRHGRAAAASSSGPRPTGR